MSETSSVHSSDSEVSEGIPVPADLIFPHYIKRPHKPVTTEVTSTGSPTNKFTGGRINASYSKTQRFIQLTKIMADHMAKWAAKNEGPSEWHQEENPAAQDFQPLP